MEKTSVPAVFVYSDGGSINLNVLIESVNDYVGFLNKCYERREAKTVYIDPEIAVVVVNTDDEFDFSVTLKIGAL